MSYSLTLTVNNVGNDEQVIAQSTCSRILFGEAESVVNYPTVDWQWKGSGGNDYITKTKGSRMLFQSPAGTFFKAGEIVASVRTVSGSSTFSQEEY